MEILAQAISERLFQFGLTKDVVRAVVETVQVEADIMRLQANRWVSLGDGARGVEILPDCS